MILNFGNDFEQKIYFDLYLSTKGSLYNYHISGLAISFKQAIALGCKIYMEQVKRNAAALTSALLKRKCRLVIDGIDNHLLLWDIGALELVDSQDPKGLGEWFNRAPEEWKLDSIHWKQEWRNCSERCKILSKCSIPESIPLRIIERREQRKDL
ncbi:hypothetical protein PIB30_074087 [Stylosanthes scabra]|uniref:Serine hydroxymethyltransferase-like domain-containing protein n=1 Tax=Stylosanthes scabra TaxID=79078 RepID=A0ABU6XPV2_9FABA|nr:hypothetical protein [Stylosanthes scabra]